MSRAGLDSPRGLSRTLTVTLRYQGVAVPLPSEPDLVLRAADLLLLQGLARGDGRPVAALVAEIATRGDVAADSLWRLLESLQRHGLLTAAAPPHAPLGGGRERAGAPAPLSNRAAAAPEPVAIATPLVLRPGPAGFDCIDHDGALVVRLDAVELAAASVLALAQPVAAGLAAHRAAAGPLALDAPRFAALVARLTDAGLVAPAAQADKGREDRFIQHAVAHQMRYTAAIDRHLTARPARPSPARVKVVPFDVRSEPMPLALGMLIAAAQAHRGGALLDHYEFCPQTIDPAQQRLRSHHLTGRRTALAETQTEDSIGDDRARVRLEKPTSCDPNLGAGRGGQDRNRRIERRNVAQQDGTRTDSGCPEPGGTHGSLESSVAQPYSAHPSAHAVDTECPQGRPPLVNGA